MAKSPKISTAGLSTRLGGYSGGYSLNAPKIKQNSLSTKLGGSFGSNKETGNIIDVQNKLTQLGLNQKKFSTPNVTALAEKYKAANSIGYTSAADEYAKNKPTAITGLGSDYFQNLRTQRLESLRNEFFGDFGKFETGMYGESASGRLGSGVAKTLLQETVARPYTEQFGAIESDIYGQQQQEAARVETFNTEQMANYNSTLASLRAQDANVELQINELANTAALAEAGMLNDNEIAAYKLQLDSLNAALDDYRTEQQIDQTERQITYPEGTDDAVSTQTMSVPAKNTIIIDKGLVQQHDRDYRSLLKKQNLNPSEIEFKQWYESTYSEKSKNYKRAHSMGRD